MVDFNITNNRMESAPDVRGPVAFPAGAVVVGVDGSADSDRAVRWAWKVAGARGVAVHLLHVATLTEGRVPHFAEPRAEREHAEQTLRVARRQLTAAPMACSRVMVTSAVDESLLDTPRLMALSAAPALIVASGTASLLVVGARGHALLSGLMLGSVSQDVAAHARCSVAVVRELDNPDPHRIVVGVDGSTGARAALAYAFDAANREQAPLLAVHGWHDRAAAGGSGDWAAAEHVRAGALLLDKTLAPWARRYPDVRLHSETRAVHPAQALTEASEHATMVVVGSRGRGALSALLLGSTAQQVLHYARCPVVVAR
jgi:nucleotide-binding universal stress UspA family protein